jgi:hypothetical protein
LEASISAAVEEEEEMMDLQVVWVEMVLLVVPVSSSSPIHHNKYLKNHNGF